MARGWDDLGGAGAIEEGGKKVVYDTKRSRARRNPGEREWGFVPPWLCITESSSSSSILPCTCLIPDSSLLPHQLLVVVLYIRFFNGVVGAPPSIDFSLEG